MKTLIKIFLIGLLLQFFVYNYITYGLGFNNQLIWLWKEAMILVFLGLLIYMIIKNKKIEFLQKDKITFYLEILFVVGVTILFIINVFVQKVGIGQFIMAFKYDFLGFMIYLIFFNYGKYINFEFIKKIVKFYGIIIKICLILALFWYVIISIKPGALKYFGYDRNVNEGKLGVKPPAVYYTKLNHGLVRNQFLFERPINYGFFLTAFWPLFFVLYLRRKSLKKTGHRWFLYGLNVVLTFSRAAWGAWIFEVFLLGILTYRKSLKRYLYRTIFPLLVLMSLILIVGYKHMITREFSNTGHKVLLVKGFTMFSENPLIGKGGAYAGPGSHQICAQAKNDSTCLEIANINKDLETGLKGFNTENQYLQILVEFGIIGFLVWISIYLYLNLYGLILFKKYGLGKKADENTWYLVAMSVGMIALSIEGMVLHSFVDRMIVYPMMLLQGLIFGWYLLNNEYKVKN